LPHTHSALREGARLGLIVATTIWFWIAGVDAVVGQPFRTFTVLGGVVLFTVLHYGLNIAYAVAILSAIHGAQREPRLVLGVAFGFIIVEVGFALLTALLSQLGLGELAWVRVLGGNVVGAIVGTVVLFRTHPVAQKLKAAEAKEEEEA
jgi:hypothetical protein